jgi:hypothetical protein
VGPTTCRDPETWTTHVWPPPCPRRWTLSPLTPQPQPSSILTKGKRITF